MLSPQSNRILIVDDLPDNTLLLQLLLESEGYTVDVANSGETALSKIENALPDLVLLDIMMPDMDGYEVTRRIRANQCSSLIPIMLLTAHGAAVAEKGLESGADDFICKPINLNELLLRVKVYL